VSTTLATVPNLEAATKTCADQVAIYNKEAVTAKRLMAPRPAPKKKAVK
jgi:hypothetical protein